MAVTKDGYESHTFDPSKKITKIEHVIQNENRILRINFYSGKEKLVMVGFDNERVKFNARIEEFVIGEDEQLIGCELDHKD